MNNKINVVLADESPEFRRLIRERLDNGTQHLCVR